MNEKQIERSVQRPIIFEIEFNIVEKISTNKIYSGTHYRTRMKHKEVYQWEVIRAIKEAKLDFKPQYPLSLFFTFYFKKNLLDSSNCSYMAKLIEDSLVKQGVIENDNTNFVSWVGFKSCRGDNKIKLEAFGEHQQDSTTIRTQTEIQQQLF